jgi:hypothetical protein
MYTTESRHRVAIMSVFVPMFVLIFTLEFRFVR